METYRNLGMNSGVKYFQIGNSFIEIIFKHNPRVYRYSYIIPGKIHVDNMKILALKGQGLNSYIKKYVGNKFEK